MCNEYKIDLEDVTKHEIPKESKEFARLNHHIDAKIVDMQYGVQNNQVSNGSIRIIEIEKRL